MTTERISVDAAVVPLISVKPHPRNPRIGNVDVIAESLTENQQYKPILVQRSTRLIIAGSHTWKAARRLGWESIAVTWLDADDDEALSILLADNKTSDDGQTDETLAFQMLATLPSLAGTGYSPEDLQIPEPTLQDFAPPPERETPDDQPQMTRPMTFQIGSAKGYLATEAYETWRATLPRKNSEAVQVVLERLGLIEEIKAHVQGETNIDVERVPLASLVPYPNNPRMGNLGAIMMTLEQHGQFRPIVVNRRNNRILTGNHVALAAERLGWQEIGVVWVDAEPDLEKRIVLVDNRSADLATYDAELLGQALATIDPRAILGTGFTLDDLDDVLSGDVKHANGSTAEVSVIVGKLKTKVRLALLRDVALTDGQELTEAAAILGIDPSGVLANVNPA